MLDARNPHQALSVVTPPTAEPVSVVDAKQHSRITITDDDNLVADLITAAREWLETATRRALAQQTLLLTLDRFPLYYDWYEYSPYQTTAPYQSASQWQTQNLIYLPKAPLQSVSSIRYLDTSGAVQTLDPSQYQVDSQSEPGRVGPAYSTFWPSTQAQIGAVMITYVAGYTLTPARVRMAIKLLVGHWYENREAAGAELAEQPLAVQSLVWSLRYGRYV